jgi:hypothetical protein
MLMSDAINNIVDAPEARVGPPRKTLTRKQLARRVLVGLLLVALIPLSVGVWWFLTFAPASLWPMQSTLSVRSAVCGTWDATVWPEYSALDSGIDLMDADSEGNLWAGTWKGSVARGDGKSWQHVATLRSDDGKKVSIVDIEARAHDDVWVLGSYWLNDRPDSIRSVLFRWNGTHLDEIAVPDLFAESGINAVAAVSEDDVWFVGSGKVGTPKYIWHWDGREVAPHTDLDFEVPYLGLNVVEAINADDIWAMSVPLSIEGGNVMVAHWDGKEWRDAADPDGRLPIFWAQNIAAISHTDIWIAAVNTTAHWDGGTWREVPIPEEIADGSMVIQDIAANTSDDVWAVGYAGNVQSVAKWWNGMAWSAIPSPRPLNMTAFDRVVLFKDKIWVGGSAYQHEDGIGPNYAMTAEFRREPCLDDQAK